ncbi:DNA-methyltransferase [Streptomyces sp. NBC_01422]|uniref:DNA-methyltransferase n=1 Tax=Streptomyces sp. NBC_01422 TaxID=2903859 RepID=UPI002E2DE60A|nr:site-specific DNA-methyltransferase [Streptomyces sp. NBC_01422]
MTEYYCDGQVTLHLGDCLDVLATLPDASVDAVITDPPYEIGVAGQSWDSTGIAYSVPMWVECLRVLKPGGHLLSFGAPRTYHRMVVAAEDAGFQVRDTINWVYGQGYPGGKTQLKPGHELILVARKRCEGTETANRGTHGVGGLQISPCRTETGRWPANAVFTHSPGCTEPDCLPGCPVAELDHQSGIRTSGTNAVRTKAGHFMGNGGLGKAGDVQVTYGDTGGASRYFAVFRFESKVTARSKGAKHLTPKPFPLMRWLVRLACPPGGTVLDPFAGSSTTLVAAREEGMAAIGIEERKVHADMSAERLSEPYMVGLFDATA